MRSKQFKAHLSKEISFVCTLYLAHFDTISSFTVLTLPETDTPPPVFCHTEYMYSLVQLKVGILLVLQKKSWIKYSPFSHWTKCGKWIKKQGYIILCRPLQHQFLNQIFVKNLNNLLMCNLLLFVLQLWKTWTITIDWYTQCSLVSSKSVLS